MPVTSDIARSYRAPRAVFRDHLSAGVSEGRAFAWLMGACALLFVAQFPRLAREAHLSGGEPSFAALASGALMGTVFLAPILFYALAPLGALAARAFGARPGWRAARAALFWALLASSPLALLHGLAAGFLGPGPQQAAVGAAWGAAFLWFWGLGLAEAGTARSAGSPG